MGAPSIPLTVQRVPVTRPVLCWVLGDMKSGRTRSPTLQGSESSWQGRSLHNLAVKSLDTTASAVKSKHDDATDPGRPRLRLQAGRDFYP